MGGITGFRALAHAAFLETMQAALIRQPRELDPIGEVIARLDLSCTFGRDWFVL